MEGIKNYFERMGSNFMVAAFIPSLGFVTLCMLIFSPIFPPKLVERLSGNENSFIQNSLITLVISIVIGFTLTSLNVFIYKLFEGYVFLNRFKFLTKRKQEEARRIKNQEKHILQSLDILIKQQETYKNLTERENLSPELKDLYEKKLALIQRKFENLTITFENLHGDYDSKFPQEEQYILPTRFGNILRAAEAYSENRYKIDGVLLWTRIIKIIDKDYMAFIDITNDQCSFLLYCCLLSGVFSILCVLVSGYQLFLREQFIMGKKEWLYFIPLTNNQSIYDQRVVIYLVIALFSFVIAFFFYKASLWNVDQYGDMIRSTYDLYRYKLLDELNITPPTDFKDEKDKWRKLSEFISIGEAYGPIQPDFQYRVNNQLVDVPPADKGAYKG